MKPYEVDYEPEPNWKAVIGIIITALILIALMS